MQLGWGCSAEAVGKLLKRFHQRPVNYGCSRGRGGEEEGEPSLYLSWAGVTIVPGLSCMSGAPVFNHRGDILLLFSSGRLIAYSLVHRPICQLSLQTAAESANEWVPEDLPAGPSAIIQVPLPGPLLPHMRYQPRFTVHAGDRDQWEVHGMKEESHCRDGWAEHFLNFGFFQ